MPVISDDGRVLLEDTPEGVLPPVEAKNITPADIVGPFEADTYISTFELWRLRNERLALGDDVAETDRARFPIPFLNLTAGWCIDVRVSPRAPKAEIEAAWNAAYERIMRQVAAELAVRRELRAKRVGIRLD